MRALIGFGSNRPFGERAGLALFEAAAGRLSQEGLVLQRLSSGWRSLAWPDPRDPPFTNAAGAFDALSEDPADMYAILARVEAEFGRVRGQMWGPRTLDLDLIDLGGRVVCSQGVRVPHPRAAGRAFVLAPLLELAPDWRWPLTGEAGAALLARAPDRAAVWRSDSAMRR